MSFADVPLFDPGPPAPPDTPLDPARLKYQVALCCAGLDLEPGMTSVKADADEIVVFAAGAEVGRIPRWQVRQYDPQLMRDLAALTAARLPAFQTDRAIAAINAEDYAIDAPPDSSWIFVDLIGHPFMKVHRRDVVPGWPPGVE